MKPLDIFLLVIAILWMLKDFLVIYVLLNSFEVKYQKAKITVGWFIFMPYILIALVLYRVYG